MKRVITSMKRVITCRVLPWAVAATTSGWMVLDGWWTNGWPDHLTTRTSYLYTLMLTLRVCVVFSCLSKEDVAALRHGTVFITSGLVSWHTTKELGIWRDRVPSGDRQSSHNACVSRHCKVFTLLYLYTKIYYIRKIANHLNPHKPPTHLSLF